MKAEDRKPMAEPEPKTEGRTMVVRHDAAFRISEFGLASDFGIRPSAFLSLSWN